MALHEASTNSPKTPRELVEKGYDPAMGARPLRRAIQRHRGPLGRLRPRRGAPPGSTIMVDRKGEEEVDITIIPGEEREPVAVPAGDASEPEGPTDDPAEHSDD
jgi:ATP-dependent Clp protease ATP-binding subunit ClpC